MDDQGLFDNAMLREQAQRLFRERQALRTARDVLDGRQVFDDRLWTEVGQLGWPGARIPEAYGGLGLSADIICAVAEELGASLAAIPYSSTVYFAAEAILLAGSDEDKLSYLPDIASGNSITTFAFAQQAPPDAAGRVDIERLLVPDALIADRVIIAYDPGTDAGVGLYMIDLSGAGVTRMEARTIDPTRPHGWVSLSRAAARLLGDAELTRAQYNRLVAQAAIFQAHEQLGGADACLIMARDYALDRYAFGRPIGSFQAIKHKLARMVVFNELARSNIHHAGRMIAEGTEDLTEFAAAARLSAISAYDYAARENIEVFGGMGFTWEADCHLYYRRAKFLASNLGGTTFWSERLLAAVETKYR